MCFLAARAPWVSGSPKIIVVPGVGGFQSVNLNAGGGSTASAITLGGGAAGAASLFVVVFAIVGLLARNGRRTWFGLAAVAASVALIALVIVAAGITGRAERSGLKDPHIRPVAIAIAVAGAVAAAAASAAGVLAASSAPVATLPEAAPEMPRHES